MIFCGCPYTRIMCMLPSMSIRPRIAKKRGPKPPSRRKKVSIRSRKRPAPRRRSYNRRRTERGSIIYANGTIYMMLPGKLKSPNKLKTGLARHGDTKAWEARIRSAQIVQTDDSVRVPVDGKVQLFVERLVPNKSCFLDQTNAAFSIKGLEDALVRLDYMVDDNHQWADVMPVKQVLSPDKLYWASVRIVLLS